jgi:hypothetical protein
MLAKQGGIGIGRVNGDALIRDLKRVNGTGDFVV